MAAEGARPRARRSRARGDVVTPRAVARAVVLVGVLAVAAAFGAGWWLGRHSALDGVSRASAGLADTASVVTEAHSGPQAPRASVAARPPTSAWTSSTASIAAPQAGVAGAPERIATASIAAASSIQAGLGPRTAAPAAAPAPPPVDVRTRAPARGFGIQLGAFETEAEARSFVAAHAAALARLPVYMVPTTIDGRGTWHRVRAGDVKTRAAADALRAGLAPELAARAIVVSHK